MSVFRPMEEAWDALHLSLHRGAMPVERFHGSIFQHLLLGVALHDAQTFDGDWSMLEAQAQLDDALEPRLQHLLSVALDTDFRAEPEQLAVFITAVRQLLAVCRGHMLLPVHEVSFWAKLPDDIRAEAFLAPPGGWQEQLATLKLRQPRAPSPVAMPAASDEVIPADMSADAEVCDLPIMAFREQILNHIADNQLTIIQADTGAGKVWCFFLSFFLFFFFLKKKQEKKKAKTERERRGRGGVDGEKKN